jgi:hypothetical protein
MCVIGSEADCRKSQDCERKELCGYNEGRCIRM